MIFFPFLHCRLDDKYVIQCKKIRVKGWLQTLTRTFWVCGFFRVNKSFCVIVILCHFRFWKRKVLYIINIYIYLLYSGGNDIEFQKWHKMTMTQNDTFSFSYCLDSSWKGKLYTKIQGFRIPHIHSNLQHCFLSFLTCFA